MEVERVPQGRCGSRGESYRDWSDTTVRCPVIEWAKIMGTQLMGQVSGTHSNYHQTLYPRTSRLTRGLGSGRPLVHPVYTGCSSTGTTHSGWARAAFARRRLVARGSRSRWRRQSQYRRERTQDQHVFLGRGVHLRRQAGPVLGA